MQRSGSRLAQFVNYDTYRAMFEAQSKYRMGVLLWMSHSCWPSFVWQTYDYFFEPTAAYYGCKKGSEPLHIQWNCANETIEVVNYNAGKVSGLTASVEILNMDGKRVDLKTATLDSVEDSTTACINMKYPAGLSSGSLPAPCAQPGSEDALFELLHARLAAERFSRHPPIACTKAGRYNHRGAKRRSLGAVNKAAEHRGIACVDGARESSARKDGRSHSAGNLL